MLLSPTHRRFKLGEQLLARLPSCGTAAPFGLTSDSSTFLYPQIPIEFKLDTCKFQLSADSAPHQATLYINRCLQTRQAHFQIYCKRMPSFVDCEKISVLKIFNFCLLHNIASHLIHTFHLCTWGLLCTHLEGGERNCWLTDKTRYSTDQQYGIAYCKQLDWSSEDEGRPGVAMGSGYSMHGHECTLGSAHILPVVVEALQ